MCVSNAEYVNVYMNVSEYIKESEKQIEGQAAGEGEKQKKGDLKNESKKAEEAKRKYTEVYKKISSGLKILIILIFKRSYEKCNCIIIII